MNSGDVPQLLQLLQACLSSDAATQKSSEALLASLEQRPGFYACLAAVVGSPDAPHSARWLAAVQLKNGVARYWRPRYGGGGGLSAEERAHLRSALLALVPQDDNQIAAQVALVVAKVARADFPAAWPTLFADLLARISPPPPTAAAAADAGQQHQQHQQHQQQQPPPPPPLLMRRTYFVLHHVLKELASKRLAADQRAFADVTRLLFDHVWSSWGALLNDLVGALPPALAAGGAAPPALLLAFERWLLLLKILRRMLVFGFPSDAKTLEPVPAVALVAPQLLAAIGALQAARPPGGGSGGGGGGTAAPAPTGAAALIGRSQLSAMVERGCLKLLKTLAQVQAEHPWSFQRAGVLLPLLEHCTTQLAASAGAPQHSAAREALLTVACDALQAVLRCDAYAGRNAGAHHHQGGGAGGGGAGEREAAAKRMAAEASAELGAWWAAPAQPPAHLPSLAALLQAPQLAGRPPPTRMSALLLLLVGGYFPLSARELDDWGSDAEAFAHAHADTAAAGEGLRASASRLALGLLLADPASLAPLLAGLLRAASEAVPPGWAGAPPLPGPAVQGPPGGRGQYPQLLLLKEAVLDAAALAAYELHGQLDYSAWLRGALLPEMAALASPSGGGAGQACGGLLPLLPRAAARCVGQWVAELKAGDRPAAYAALAGVLAQPALPPDERDPAAQLAAVAALRALVDDFGFEAAPLLPALPAIVGALRVMLERSEELDTQTQVFGLLNLVVERLGPDVGPHVGALLPLLPATWAAAAEQSLLRIQVLTCMGGLLNVLGPESPATYAPVVLPLLCEGLDPNGRQPELLEDALALWLVALRNAPGGEAAAPLLELTPALTAALTSSTEHIAVGMQLLTSLLLAGGAPLLAAYGEQLCGALAGYVGEVVERGLLLLLPPVDLLLVAAPQQAAPLLQPFMVRLLALVLGGRESGVLVANALALFARLLLQHPAAFEAMLGAAAAAGVTAAAAAPAAPSSGGPAASAAPPPPPSPEALLLALAGVWCDAFDSIAQPLARKLSACGLAALLGLPVKGLLLGGLLPGLLSHVVSAWLELEASGADDASTERGQELYGFGLWGSNLGGGGSGWGGDESGLLLTATLVASEEASGEAARRQALRDAEPLRGVRLSSLLRDKLAQAAALHGGDFAAAMAALDPAIREQVQAVLQSSAGGGGAGGVVAGPA